MIKPRVNTLIFDLDNTLIDRNLAMRTAILGWLQLQGYSTTEAEKTITQIMERDFWGYADRIEFCSYLLNAFGDKKTANSAAQLADYFFKNITKHVQPNPLVNATLESASKHFDLVLASNGNSITQRTKLGLAQLLKFFPRHSIFISEEMGYEKPDVEFFKKIIRDLDLDGKKTMSIGDHPVNDIKAAAECGLQTCWISHGREPHKDFYADMVINNITAIEACNFQ